ncbi:MetQ/NlpA family ABC transporter substrate-binding protein [Bacillus vallismortis]|uniref:MetQ/NlpA family ABC transporter substrate-binding protein n=1 Tax=Bacillus vallismortis TaxID=72361 RepID=UPI0020908424|nr:MetQ/NlpA family ABC transporter substrate-binding protein [Bacillus vallismortis]MCO4851528.1 MetQ/NlpA family ABC transporter substrate-binding protein [Bacillus vallismortis]
MKKWLICSFVFILLVSFTACSPSAEHESIKIGIAESDEAIWNYIAEKAEEAGLDIELIFFSDYAESDIALANKEIDANALQTISYFRLFTEKYKHKLAPLGTTYITPMGIYSKRFGSIQDIPRGAAVSVPDKAFDFGRALTVLQEAGVLTLKNGFNGTGSADMIKNNPRHLKLKAVREQDAVRSADVFVMKPSEAKKAGLQKGKHAIKSGGFMSEEEMNLIVVRTEDQDREALQTILELYQADDTAALIEKEYQGDLVPAFLPLKRLSDWKNEFVH